MSQKRFSLHGEYDVTFIEALACAVHLKLIEPEELVYFFERKWSNKEIAKELYDRVKASRV